MEDRAGTPNHELGFRHPGSMETLSSYLAAWRGHFHVEEQAFEARLQKIDPTVLVALQVDPDYPAHPGWQTTLASATNLKIDVFKELGMSHGPWPLFPKARRCACLACLEMSSAPDQQFISDFWNQSTITVCWFHGLPLVEVPAVGWGWSEFARFCHEARAQAVRPKVPLQPRQRRPALDDRGHRSRQ